MEESIIVPIYKKGDKRDCSDYRGILTLSDTYKILSNILLSRLTPYAEDIIGGHPCGLRRNRSTTDHNLSQYLTNLIHKICFTISFISCLYMFRAHVFIIRRSKLHYAAPGIITPIGGRLVHV